MLFLEYLQLLHQACKLTLVLQHVDDLLTDNIRIHTSDTDRLSQLVDSQLVECLFSVS